MGSIVARFRRPNNPILPIFVGPADRCRADIRGVGRMGPALETVNRSELTGRYPLVAGVTLDRLGDHERPRRRFDDLRAGLGRGDAMDSGYGY